MKNHIKHFSLEQKQPPKLRLLLMQYAFGFLVSLILLTGCGVSSEYARLDTPEGEAFLKKTKEAWTEVQALIDPKSPQAIQGHRDPEMVHRKITKVMQESSGAFQALMKAKKISKAQCDRYLAMINQFAKK